MASVDATAGATAGTTASATAEPPAAGGAQLARTIGPTMLVVLIVGDMLGAGIYALVGNLARHVGGMVWLPLAIGFAVAALTAASYAELVGKYPQAAGAALYVQRAFRRPFFTFIVAFAVLMSGVASASAAALAFGGKYLTQLVEAPRLVAAFVFLGVITVVNFIGISKSIKVNLVLTALEVGGIVIVIVVGLLGMLRGTGDVAQAFELGAPSGAMPGVLAATALGFYALIGFEDSVNLAEECKSPSRTFPRALFAGIAITGALYIAVAIVAIAVLGPERLATSSGPLLDVVIAGGVAFPPELFALLALLAITNTALMNMIMASRLLYGMAGEGIVPRPFARVHPTRRTPYVAIAFTVAIASALILSSLVIGDGVADLASTTVVLLLLVFAVVNVSVLVLRRRPVEHAHFRTPRWAPVLGAAASLLLASPAAGIEPHVYLIAASLVGVGALLWGVNRLLAGRPSPGEAPGTS
jgi:basic amino acid/polyamine antiporter, APA family